MVTKASGIHTHVFGRLAAGACVMAGIRLRHTLRGRGQPSALALLDTSLQNICRDTNKFENFSEETRNYLKRKRLEKIKQILELRNIRNCSTCALLTMPKPLTVWITTNGGEFFKRWEYQTT